jgi:hypothetical protein
MWPDHTSLPTRRAGSSRFQCTLPFSLPASALPVWCSQLFLLWFHCFLEPSTALVHDLLVRCGVPGCPLLAISQSVRSRLLQSQQAGQCPLKRAGGLDGAQGLDGTDEGAALSHDAGSGIGDGHLKIPTTWFGSGGGVGDRPADHDLGAAFTHTAPVQFVPKV